MFEGYVGIRLWSGQLMADVWFTVIFILFLLFAINSRIHVKSFVKMFRYISVGKNKNSELSLYNKKSFNFFMVFQSMLLTSLIFTQEAYYRGYLNNITQKKLFMSLAMTFIVIFGFYLLRRIIYYILIYIFASQNFYKQWIITYNALTGIWGITLYIPAICITFLDNYHFLAIGIMILFYLAFRLAIIYKTTRLFHIKKFDLFYLSLYLCSHEILPLIILLKGFVYLYNFIEKSALWH